MVTLDFPCVPRDTGRVREMPARARHEFSGLCGGEEDLAERYSLRAYDSVHLAAFAEVARQAGVRDTRFSSFDDGLIRAERSLRRVLTRGQ